MNLRIRSFFIGLKTRRQSILLAVLLALVVLFTFSGAFPPNFDPGLDDDPRGGAMLALTSAASSAASLHLPALSARPPRRVRDREHLRARPIRRRSADRSLDPIWGISLSLIASIHLAFDLVLASRRRGSFHLAEYLKSHIGEKRFADAMPAFLVSFCLPVYSVTVLRTAPSLFYSSRGFTVSPGGGPIRRR